MDAAARRGTVDVPVGVGMQEAIETGLADGWVLAGPVWQLSVQGPADETPTWWTAAPVLGLGPGGIAVWVSPDRDATLAPMALESPARRPWERPDEVYLYAANDVARRASIWTDANDTPYADHGRSVRADERVAVCAASTQRQPTEFATPPDQQCEAPDRTYLIQPGDTLASIAEAVYGDPSRFGVIAQANGLNGNNPLTTGRELTIPGCPQGATQSSTTAPADTAGTTPGEEEQAALGEDERALLDAFVQFAHFPSRPTVLRWADSVSLHLADRPPSATFTSQEVSGPVWSIEAEGFRAYTGPFNPLELIADTSFLLAFGAGTHPHCASPPVPPPEGLEDMRRLWIQPEDTSSCTEWFTVDLFIDEDGAVTAVTMDLWEP
ncbi:LysM peptidoglycan-binding domain-containing protein [Euzebya sp.]|uniref:LysM peptidoglycan-binding domain-containing protein n=2 Tax=Euzebya sp. TaxID=1971409 RepID=UPI0035596C54